MPVRHFGDQLETAREVELPGRFILGKRRSLRDEIDAPQRPSGLFGRCLQPAAEAETTRIRVDRDPIELKTAMGARHSAEAGIAVETICAVREKEMIARSVFALGEILVDQLARDRDFAVVEDSGLADEAFDGRTVFRPNLCAEFSA